MYRCHRCGTAFVDPVPSGEELTRFYARYHLSDAEGGLYDPIEDRMRADFPAKIQSVVRAAGGAPKALLDVGCGKGFFVRACCDRGINAEGIDLSSSGVAYATSELRVKASCGTLKQLKSTLGKFDVITFWATIEHLPDPIDTLRDIHDVLSPGGVLLLDTGIGDDWLDRMLPGTVQWYDPPQHLFVFSAPGLTRALAAAGFAVEHLDRCFERSLARRVVRLSRACAVASGLRLAAAMGRVRAGPFNYTRFPLGNLMMAVARKPA